MVATSAEQWNITLSFDGGKFNRVSAYKVSRTHSSEVRLSSAAAHLGIAAGRQAERLSV